ncbi:MAG: hydrogenase nickel incorporation protein HypB [Spirochaetia bacterium]
MKEVEIGTKILTDNERQAVLNREYFGSLGVTVVNLIGSPGSGKTTILERTFRDLAGQVRFAVIEGDLETDHDAVVLRKTGVPVEMINTHGACHLNAAQVRGAAERLDLEDTDILIIENIGNLVCPSSFDLGEDFKLGVLSTPEGDEKPVKYPELFVRARAVAVSKLELTEPVRFDLDKAREGLLRCNPDCEIFPLSAFTGEGWDVWCDWIEGLAGK